MLYSAENIALQQRLFSNTEINHVEKFGSAEIWTRAPPNPVKLSILAARAAD